MKPPEDAPRIFNPDYYQRLYEIEEQNGWALGMRDAMEALLERPLDGRKQLRVLDIGCGTGYLLQHIASHMSAVDSVGIDLSVHALKFGQRRGNSSLALATAMQVPLASNSFDLILCIDTIQHLDPAGSDLIALRECERLLRPGGLLYLRTNSSQGHVPIEGFDPDQYRRYRLETVTGMLSEVGFEVVRATYVNAIPGMWRMVRERMQGKRNTVPATGPALTIRHNPSSLNWLNRVLHALLSFEAWLIGPMNIDLPFGHSTAFVAQSQVQPGTESY